MSEIRKFTTDLENSGVYCDVVLLSDHLTMIEKMTITTEDLSMIIRMMVTKHRRGVIDDEYCRKALDYLERKGLQGNILRAFSVGEREGVQ